MEKEKKLQYNKMCAEILNYVYVSSLDVKEGKYHPSIIAGWYKKIPGIYLPRINSHLYIGRNHFDLKFDSDWNWIHEVIEVIESIKYKTSGENIYKVPIECNVCTITTVNEEIVWERRKTKKEAVITAINKFLIWYNEKTN